MNKLERVKSVISYKGISASAFAERINFNQSNLSKILRGDREVNGNLINAICLTFPEIDGEWLLTGKGDMLKKNEAKPVTPYVSESLVYLDYVPVSIMASFIESLYDTVYVSDKYGVIPEDGETLDCDNIVFQVQGNSMMPTIPDGAKILARRISEGKWENASGVVVVVYGKTLTVKRILKNSLFTENRLTLKADNPTYGQVDISRSEIRGMWQAVRIVSQKIL